MTLKSVSTMVNMAQTHSANKLFVRNLPFSCSDDKLEELFSNDGPLKGCFVVKQSDKQLCKGYGFVTFALREDAKKVVESDKWLEGKKLHIEYATSKATDKKKERKDGKKSIKTGEGEEKEKHEVKQDETEQGHRGKRKQQGKKDESKQPAKRPMFDSHRFNNKSKLEVSNIPQKINQNNLKKFFEQQFGKVRYCNLIRNRNRRSIGKAFITFENSSSAEECLKMATDQENPLELGGIPLTVVEASAPTLMKGTKNGQSGFTPEDQEGRIVIRNLSFQCSMDDIKEEFAQFGEIVNIAIPMNKEKKTHKGFAFIQYKTREEAEKAVTTMNSKELNDRPIAVDFALPRDKYQKAKEKPQHTAVKDKSKKEVEESDEDDDSEDDDDEEGEDEDSEGSSEDEEVQEGDDESGVESSDEGMDDQDSKEDSEDSDDESEDDIEEEQKRYSDVEKGTTVFVRNLPYEVTESELRKVFMKYGLVKSCHLVLDPVTEQPRGSGFVQFVKKEHTEKCLQETAGEASPPELHGRILTVTKALSREKSADIQEKRKKIVRMEEKDPRNTYLLREGFIRPGTQAAVGLSQADLAKRAKVEAVKRAKLKNIYIFVSKTRLVVHNLPKSVDDKKLKEIFRTAVRAKTGVHVTEAKVMMDKSEVDADGKRSSLGYGFVSFRDHNHALEALRTVNNNPSYFGNSRRLIVGFSLENKKALEKKQRQIEKNKIKQGQTKTAKTGKKDSEKIAKSIDIDTDPRVDVPANARKGLPKHSHAKVRWRDRGKKEREERERRLNRRKRLFQQQGGTKQSQAKVEIVGEKNQLANEKEPKRKKRRRDEREEQRFESLVAKYKKTINQSAGGSKWFD